jgi:hypothetical protein
MINWISVDDKLPEVGVLVFIATVNCVGNDYTCAKWSGDYWTMKAWPMGYSPTYWMPIPELPK